ncbi:hypothetical protein ABPG72_007188 [Tetrahymena utriculariae]
MLNNIFYNPNFDPTKVSQYEYNQVKDYSLVETYYDAQARMKCMANSQAGKQFADFISKCINVKFIEKSFQNSNIMDIGLQDIGKGLQNCSKLEQLSFNLRRNEIGSKQSHIEFASAIDASKDQFKIINLDFAVNKMQDESPKLFMKSISTCSKLDKLFLGFSSNQISFQFQECFKGFENLKQLQKLQIDLSQNEKIGIGITKITETISTLNQLQFLHLNLQKISLTPEYLKQVTNNINQIANLIYLELNLQQNNLGNLGVEQINFSNLKHLENLKLFLGWTQINAIGLAKLLLNIKLCKSLKIVELELKWNQISENLQFEQYSLPQQIASLDSLSLHLRGNKLNSEGLSKIINYISSAIHLRQLEINAEANNLNKNLLDLGQTLSNLQIRNLKLNFEENEIENEDLVNFFKIFSQNEQLESLQISLKENKINQSCYQEFGQSLSKFKQLKQLQLQFNTFDNILEYKLTQELLKCIFKSKSINHLKYIMPFASYHDRLRMNILYQECKKSKYLVTYQFKTP